MNETLNEIPIQMFFCCFFNKDVMFLRTQMLKMVFKAIFTTKLSR